MRSRIVPCALTLVITLAGLVTLAADEPQRKAAPAPAKPPNAKLEELKLQAVRDIDGMKDFTQQMVDQIFSYGELGFQEFETAKYCTEILRKNGFTVQEGIAGIPTGFMATWGSGKPVIALGSDIDGIPQSSQKPGVAYRAPLIEGAPGHGEGHNSGVPLSITAAFAVKRIMEREKLPGTIKVWPGVAEEQLGSKSFFLREGFFKDVDLVIFSHVSNDMSTNWASDGSNGLVSIEYKFTGSSAHAAGAPWSGRSALDAVELMDVAWNFRREHLRLSQRSHSVITDGGDQPNVVPSTASVWYYFRETDYEHVKEMWDIGNDMAKAAATMTGTKVTWRILGSGWPRHYNKPAAETLSANMTRIGMPEWSEADQTLAKGIQRELKQRERGLLTKATGLRPPVEDSDRTGGGSDDIGDITWNIPTARLNFPANIPGLPGHNWANAISMATPIAHKGTTAGAKVAALMMLDYLLSPELVQQSWGYFRNVQTKDIKYVPFIAADDKPATWLNKKIMDEYRTQMRQYYFDPTKYKTYLEQLGIQYPTVRPAASSEASDSR